jgi:hypothetical protein
MVSRAWLLFLVACCAHAGEVEGVRLDERVSVDGQALQLNGMALRTRMFFKVYVAGLYLPRKASTARTAIEAEGAKRLVLVMMRDATADQFCQSIATGLRLNSSEAQLARIRPQAEALYAKIRRIGRARAGMRIVLDYAPSAAATTLLVDGLPQGEPLRGAEFFQALLRIWLGERPAQADLKRLLLGQEGH